MCLPGFGVQGMNLCCVPGSSTRRGRFGTVVLSFPEPSNIRCISWLPCVWESSASNSRLHFFVLFTSPFGERYGVVVAASLLCDRLLGCCTQAKKKKKLPCPSSYGERSILILVARVNAYD